MFNIQKKNATSNSSIFPANQKNQQQLEVIQIQKIEQIQKNRLQPNPQIQKQDRKKILLKWIIGIVISLIIIGLALGIFLHFYLKPSITQKEGTQIIQLKSGNNIVITHHRIQKNNLIGGKLDLNYSIWKTKSTNSAGQSIDMQCMIGNVSYIYYKYCNNKNRVQYLIDFKKAYEVEILQDPESKKRLLQLQSQQNSGILQKDQFEDLQKDLSQNNYDRRFKLVSINQLNYNQKLQQFDVNTNVQNSNRLLLFKWLKRLFSPKKKTIVQKVEQIHTTVIYNLNITGNNNTIILKTDANTKVNINKKRLLQNETQSSNILNNCFSTQQNSKELECYGAGSDSMYFDQKLML